MSESIVKIEQEIEESTHRKGSRFSRLSTQLVRFKSNASRVHLYLLLQVYRQMKIFQTVEFVLRFISFGQLLYFCINDRIPHIWTLNLFTYLQRLVSYFNMSQTLPMITGPVLQNASFFSDPRKARVYAVSSTVIAFTISLLLFLLVLSLVGVIFKDSSKNGGVRPDSAVRILSTVMAFCWIVFRNILIIPLAQCSYIGIFADREAIELTGGLSKFFLLGIMIYIMAGFNLLFVIFIILFFSLSNEDLNPLSSTIFASYKDFHVIKKCAFKLITPLYLFINPQESLVSIFLAYQFLFHGWQSLSSLICPPTSRLAFAFQETYSSVALTAWALFVFIEINYDTGNKTDNLVLFLIVLSLLLLSFLVYHYEQSLPLSFLSGDPFAFTGPSALAKYVYACIGLIERAEGGEQRHKLMGVWKNLYARGPSWRLGEKETEIYEEMRSLLSSVLSSSSTSPLPTTTPSTYTPNIPTPSSTTSTPSPATNSTKTASYRILSLCLSLCLPRHHKPTYLCLLQAYILAFRLDLKWKAIYMVEAIKGQGNSLGVRVAVEDFVITIEKDIEDFEIVNSQFLGIDIKAVLKSQEDHEEMQDLLTKSCNTCQAFWTTLREGKMNGQRLHVLGGHLTTLQDRSRKLHEEINSLKNTNLKTLYLYANYIQLVVCDQEEARKLFIKIENIQNSVLANRKFVIDRMFRFYQTLNPCIVLASGGKNDLGRIINANTESFRLLEYTEEEMVGGRIEMIMPEIYAQNHDFWMRRYFDLNRDQVMNHERKVFAQTKRRFIVPCNLLIKVYPNIQSGIEVVGVFSKCHADEFNKNTMIFDGRSGVLYGVSSSAYYNYGIYPGITYGHPQSTVPFLVTDLFANVSSMEELKNWKGINTHTLDSSIIKKRYAIQRNNLKGLGMPVRRSKAFTQYKVKIEMSPAESYNLESLSIIQMTFYEDFLHFRSSELKDAPEEKKGFPLHTDTHNFLNRSSSPVKEAQNKTLGEEGSLLADTPDLNEEEIELLTEKAEKERRLKEKKQMMKNKIHPKGLKIQWNVSIVVMSLYLAFALTILLRKNQFGTRTLNFYQGTLNFFSREGQFPDIAFTTMEYFNYQKELPGFKGPSRETLLEKESGIVEHFKDYNKKCEESVLYLIRLVGNGTQPFSEYKSTHKGDVRNLSLSLVDALYISLNSFKRVLKASKEELHFQELPEEEQNTIEKEKYEGYFFIVYNYLTPLRRAFKQQIDYFKSTLVKKIRNTFYEIIGFFASEIGLMLFMAAYTLFAITRVKSQSKIVTRTFSLLNKQEIDLLIQNCEDYSAIIEEQTEGLFEESLQADQEASSFGNSEDTSYVGDWEANTPPQESLQAKPEIESKNIVLSHIGNRRNSKKRSTQLKVLDFEMLDQMNEEQNNLNINNQNPSKKFLEFEKDLHMNTPKSSRRGGSSSKANENQLFISDHNQPANFRDFNREFNKSISKSNENKNLDPLFSSLKLQKASLKGPRSQEDGHSSRHRVRRRSKLFKSKGNIQKTGIIALKTDSQNQELDRIENNQSLMGKAIWNVMLGTTGLLPWMIYILYRDFDNYNSSKVYKAHLMNLMELRMALPYLATSTYQEIGLQGLADQNLTQANGEQRARILELVTKHHQTDFSLFTSYMRDYEQRLRKEWERTDCKGENPPAECLQDSVAARLKVRGIELSITQIVESTREISSIFNQSPDKPAKSREMLTSHSNLYSLAESADSLGNVLEDLAAFFIKQYTSVIHKKTTEEYFLHLVLVVSWSIVFYVNVYKFLESLKEKIWLTQSMVNMIPFTTIIENNLVYKEIIDWVIQ